MGFLVGGACYEWYNKKPQKRLIYYGGSLYSTREPLGPSALGSRLPGGDHRRLETSPPGEAEPHVWLVLAAGIVAFLVLYAVTKLMLRKPQDTKSRAAKRAVIPA